MVQFPHRVYSVDVVGPVSVQDHVCHKIGLINET